MQLSYQQALKIILLGAAAVEAQILWRANGIMALSAGLVVHAPIGQAAAVEYQFLESRKNKTAKAAKSSGSVAVADTNGTATGTGANTPCTTSAAGDEEGDCQDSTNNTGAETSGTAAAATPATSVAGSAAQNTAAVAAVVAAAANATTTGTGTDTGDNAPCTTSAAGEEEGNC